MRPTRHALLLILALAAAGWAAPAAAQDPLRVDGLRIRPGTDTLYTYFVHAGAMPLIGMVTDRIRVVERAGEVGPELHREYTSWDRVRGTDRHTITDDRATLRPLRYELRTDAERRDLRFEGDSVRGDVKPEGRATERIRRRLGEPVFNAASFDLVLRAAELAEGARFSVPAYLAPLDRTATLTATVTGTEAVPGADGVPVESWVVEADFAGAPVTFWIARDSRELLKQVLRVGPGMEVVMVRHRLLEFPDDAVVPTA